MISAFQGRDFGFGFKMFESKKQQINEFRKDSHYYDKNSAQLVYNTTSKPPLTVDPFVQFFEYGNKKEGYWSYEHMMCQLEDVIDVLSVAIGVDYKYLFLFDHSCGHDRSRPDGLHVSNMNINFGGKQSKIHDSKIECEKIRALLDSLTGWDWEGLLC